jgi:hypothetical protein
MFGPAHTPSLSFCATLLLLLLLLLLLFLLLLMLLMLLFLLAGSRLSTHARL